MSPKSKIYAYLFVWVAATAAMFAYIMPHQRSSMLSLQNSHKQQIEDLSRLTQQVRNLTQIENDLKSVEKGEVKPRDFFGRDADLVGNIKTIEEIAKLTSNAVATSISGSADSAEQYAQSASKFYSIPYSVRISGSFSGAVNFLRYFENSYFVSPISGLNISAAGADSKDPKIKTTILSNFFVVRQESNENKTKN